MASKYFLSSLLIAAVLLNACSDDEEELSLAPIIAFQSITPAVASELVDPIEIKITYYDENGDLGENDASVKNLFVVDSRNQVTYEFRIQQLAPSGSAIPIEGTLTIDIDPLVMTSSSSTESVSFSMYCKDRAGNLSNTVSTTAITINE